MCLSIICPTAAIQQPNTSSTGYKPDIPTSHHIPRPAWRRTHLLHMPLRAASVSLVYTHASELGASTECHSTRILLAFYSYSTRSLLRGARSQVSAAQRYLFSRGNILLESSGHARDYLTRARDHEALPKRFRTAAQVMPAKLGGIEAMQRSKTTQLTEASNRTMNSIVMAWERLLPGLTEKEVW